MRASADRIPYTGGQSHRYQPLDAGTEGRLRALIDCLWQGVIVADRSGRVVLANRAAQAILAAGDGLHDGPGGLRTETMESTRRLRRMVEAASGSAPAGNVMALPRIGQPHPLSVMISPLRSGAEADLALILIIAPDCVPTPWPDLLRDLYGLTDAEAAVAVAMARGEGLAAVAAKLNVGRTTVRTHLQHVFEKTGTRRQAQLVRLIMAGCVSMCAVPDALEFLRP